jgi:hypothetical protein
MPAEEEWNGLDAEASVLNDFPEGIRYALVAYDNKGSIHDTDTGVDVPRVRVRQWEPLGDRGDLQEAIMQAMFAAQEKRTGKRSLFSVEDAAENAEPDSEAVE